MATPNIFSDTMTATFVTDIDVSGRDRDGGLVPGLAALPNNRLLVADLENCRVKLLDVNTKRILSQLRFPTNPWDVTVIDVHQAAVTLPHEEKIVFLSLSDRLKKEREIAVNGECQGLTYSQGRLLVVFPRAVARLEIMDVHGNIIRTIRDNVTNGLALFSDPNYVCVSNDGEKIYVSDYHKCTVTCLTFDGVVKAVYMDEESNPWCKTLSNVNGICTDQRGQVYVCFNRGVYVITSEGEDGEKIEVQDNRMWYVVQSVCHCQDTNRLYVGTTQNTVKVYQRS